MLNNNSFLALFVFLTSCFASHPIHISLYLFAFSPHPCYICAMWTKLILLSPEQQRLLAKGKYLLFSPANKSML